MLFKNISILDEKLEEKHNMNVLVEGDKISYIGPDLPQVNDVEVYEGKGKLLMSGFFNSHAHTPMTLLRGYGENLPLQDWLEQRIFPFEAQLVEEDVYYGALLGIAESFRYGIISTTDMYYMCDKIGDAFLESGGKANLSQGVTCFDDSDLKDLPAYKESVDLFNNYHQAGDGRIKVDMSLHGEYTSTEKVAGQLAQLAKELGAGMHVHVSETLKEHEECKARYGKTPIQYLNDLGLLDTRTTAAHCVYVEGEDLDIMRDKKVTVASNPISNLKLASGICNVPELLEKDINVAIGTDSVASNNSLNYIEEMKFFGLVHKAGFNNPKLTTPYETIYAATRAGALGQGREDSGLLAEGYKADLVVLDISQPNMHPVHDMKTNVVYSASGSDVVLTMIDGKVVYKDGEFPTIDLEKVKFETGKSVERILGELK